MSSFITKEELKDFIDKFRECTPKTKTIIYGTENVIQRIKPLVPRDVFGYPLCELRKVPDCFWAEDMEHSVYLVWEEIK